MFLTFLLLISYYQIVDPGGGISRAGPKRTYKGSKLAKSEEYEQVVEVGIRHKPTKSNSLQKSDIGVILLKYQYSGLFHHMKNQTRQ